jgi:hypothetical protein
MREGAFLICPLYCLHYGPLAGCRKMAARNNVAVREWRRPAPPSCAPHAEPARLRSCGGIFKGLSQHTDTEAQRTEKNARLLRLWVPGW